MTLDGQLDVTTNHDVEFRFTVTNIGTDPIELVFQSSFVTDFVIYEDGEAVWRWSNGRMFAQMLRTETLVPDEEVVYTGTWEDPEPGEFEAVATLKATNVDLESRITFDV